MQERNSQPDDNKPPLFLKTVFLVIIFIHSFSVNALKEIKTSLVLSLNKIVLFSKNTILILFSEFIL